MTKVAFVAHHQRDLAVDTCVEALGWLREQGHEAWLDADDALVIGVEADGPRRPLAEADLVVSLGGDGTMLRAVGLLGGAPVPILGVNLGVLGYLTEIETPELIDVLRRFLAGPEPGAWHLDERMLLQVAVRGSVEGSWRALNEIVVEKHESGHTIRLLVRIGGAPFTSYAADGMIVATPTGSTAYSMSARGPIVSPRHRALLVTPVSPHMLFDRTLVLDPAESVELELSGFRPADLSVDGQVVTALANGDVLTCCPAVETAMFVRVRPYHFHQILKAKFGLSDR